MSWSNIHIVVVTYNRATLLRKVLSRLTELPRVISVIHVCNNASVDNTIEVVEEFMRNDSRIVLHNFETNLGGAGGFSRGMRIAMSMGASWIGLMDDDLLIHENALEKLSKYEKKYNVMALCRENTQGKLSEFAAIKFDLKNPLHINPKVASVLSFYKSKKNCPEVIEVDCASFEGFFIKRSVVEEVGFPFSEYFIYGDDFDYCLRLKKNGLVIGCIRDAVGTRLLPYQKTKFNSWKTYYIWRNFFILHFLYGDNLIVRLKPFVLTLGLFFVAFIRGIKVESFKILRDALVVSNKIKSRLTI